MDYEHIRASYPPGLRTDLSLLTPIPAGLQTDLSLLTLIPLWIMNRFELADPHPPSIPPWITNTKTFRKTGDQDWVNPACLRAHPNTSQRLHNWVHLYNGFSHSIDHLVITTLSLTVISLFSITHLFLLYMYI